MKSTNVALNISLAAKLMALCAATAGISACDGGGQILSHQTIVDASADNYEPGDDPLYDMDAETGPIDYGVTGIDLTNRVSGKADGLSDINDFVGPPNAHTKGAWSAAAEWPLSAIHAALLPTGHVATYGTDELGNNASGFIYDLWNPHMGLGASAHNTLDNKTNTNTFCSAQTVLSNGQLLISGGDENGLPDGYKGDGISQSVLLNPVTEKMSRAAKMSYARWYPTLVGLPNGENLILGGRSAKPRDGGKSYGVRTPEIYNTNTGKYRKLTGINNDFFERSWYYPRAYVGNTGKVFITRNGSHDVWRMSWTGKGSIEKNVSTRGEVFSQQYPSVVYRPGKVLTLTKGKGAKILDIRGNNATISSTSALGVQRLFSDATVLSDGRVLVTGGSSIRQDLASAHYKAQIWSPGNGKWRDLASASKARLYHSTALLLPNGAVLVTGGGPPGPVVNMNAEIFYPPYLFKKDGSGELANRPSISSMPAVKYGQKFAINYSSATAIKRVAMIRVGSVTHSFDQSQRYVPLSFTTSRNKLIINGPKNKNQAPPGQYMLVIIDKNGVPSHAEMFQPS